MRNKIASIVIGVVLLAFCGLGLADDKFVASKASDKYHVPTCGIAKQIKKENLIGFNSEAEAQKAGYKPCKICIKPDAKKAAFIGSKDSDKYHLPTCKIIDNIKPEKQVAFASKEEAEKAGYKPCQICLPSKDKTKDKPKDKPKKKSDKD